MTNENNSASGSICASGGSVASGSIIVSGSSLLHISGVTGEYVRLDTEPYQITLYREKKEE